MKKILLAFLAAILLAAPAVSSSHQPKPFESVRALATTIDAVAFDPQTGEIVEGKVYRNRCTATSFNEKNHLWLTAAHCVANEDMTAVDLLDYAIGNPEQGYFHAVIVAVDLGDDMAILGTPDYTAPALKVSKHDVEYGDKILVYGHPFGWDQAVLFTGMISAPSVLFDPGDKPYMLYQVSCAPGNSGSAVLNEHNEIVSVLQISWERTFAAVCGGSPQPVLYSFLKPYLP